MLPLFDKSYSSKICKNSVNDSFVLCILAKKLVDSVVEWLKRHDCDGHSFVSKLAPFFCVLGKNTLRHFPLLGGLGKQLQI